MSHAQLLRHLLCKRQALHQARGNFIELLAVVHMQSYQARDCSQLEQLCSHKSSPKLALLMLKRGVSKVLKMAVLDQVSCNVHWQEQCGAETRPLG